MTTAIEFNNISKQYRLGLISTRTLSHDLNRWWSINVLRKEDPYLKIGDSNDRSTKGTSDYVWALKDIDFKVEQGDVVGIIGKNGAGKSTLLKLLSRVTGPTTGTIKAKGRIGSLLEVGTGFHPEMTGRENIYMNGAILGMTKAEIKRKLDEIVDFSGCERYIDTPVKRYSSGMMVRLGFAVAAHLDPEILVVDEVLAVGDAEFQKKAIGKMKDVSKGEGRTVLFVSHNMASIKMLCNNGVVLKNGRIDFGGDISDAVNFYLKENEHQFGKIMDDVKCYSSVISIKEISINNSVNNEIKLDNSQLALDVEIVGMLNSVTRLELEALIYDSNNILLATYCPGHSSGTYAMHKAGGFLIKERISLPENITEGDFYLQIKLSDPNVAYLAELSKPIKIIAEGMVGEGGMCFRYKERGFLILKQSKQLCKK